MCVNLAVSFVSFYSLLERTHCGNNAWTTRYFVGSKYDFFIYAQSCAKNLGLRGHRGHTPPFGPSFFFIAIWKHWPDIGPFEKSYIYHWCTSFLWPIGVYNWPHTHNFSFPLIKIPKGVYFTFHVPFTPCRKSTHFWLTRKWFYNGCLWEFFCSCFGQKILTKLKNILTDNHYKTILESVRSACSSYTVSDQQWQR